MNRRLRIFFTQSTAAAGGTGPNKIPPLLEPAVEAVQRAWKLLGSVAPDAITGLLLSELEQRLGYLRYLRRLQKCIVGFATSLDNTIAVAETGLMVPLDQIFKRAKSMI